MKCPECRGSGRIVGYVCPGFRRVEASCEHCGGSGTAPPWRFEAVEAGLRLRGQRLAADRSLRDQADRDGVSALLRSDCEHGRIPLDQWPEVLRVQFDPLERL